MERSLPSAAEEARPVFFTPLYLRQTVGDEAPAVHRTAVGLLPIGPLSCLERARPGDRLSQLICAVNVDPAHWTEDVRQRTAAEDPCVVMVVDLEPEPATAAAVATNIVKMSSQFGVRPRAAVEQGASRATQATQPPTPAAQLPVSDLGRIEVLLRGARRACRPQQLTQQRAPRARGRGDHVGQGWNLWRWQIERDMVARIEEHRHKE